MSSRRLLVALVLAAASWWTAEARPESKTFQAGAAAVEITPAEFPRIISGGFLQGRADRANDPLFARALVLDDGQTRLAIVVVDTLMMPRTLIDEAKQRASKATGIPADRMLVSATHTHSAPSVMGALGTGVDEDYARRLPGWIAQSVEHAVKNLAPARIGWATAVDSQHTNCRRWIKRPDRIGADPFGGQTVRAMMQLLEQVSGKPRRKAVEPAGPYVAAVRASKPVAYWRLGDLTVPQAADATRHQNHAIYEDGIAPYLDGVDAPGVAGPGQTSRAAHFAGGRLKAALDRPGPAYSVEFWFWNGLPSDARAVTGYLFSRGPDGVKGAPGDHLGIGGTHSNAGRLFLYNGDAKNETLVGTTEIPLRTWHHVVLVRDGAKAAVHLDGRSKPEIAGEIQPGLPEGAAPIFFGGRNDGFANFEGKLDEVAVYDRPLAPDEIAAHYTASGAK